MKTASLSFTAQRSGNRLLDALCDRDLVEIERDIQIVVMLPHQSSLSAGQLMQHVHFPIDAVLSIIVTLNGQSVEVGTIGNESFAECDAALEAAFAARSTICQVRGRVGLMAIDVFQKRLANPSFARLMRKNVGASLYSTQQYLACIAKHSDLARCARWLLMTADRAGRPKFSLSRDFLGIMLGVQKDHIRDVIAQLTSSGAATYVEADVTIVDASLLERISCECYLLCKAAFAESLFDQ